MKKESAMLKSHIEALKKLANSKVEAGWFDSDAYDDGTKTAWVAYVNEYGAILVKDGKRIRIPPRPFMRLAFKNFVKGQNALQKRLAKRLVSGQISSAQYLGQIALALEGEIVKSIKNGPWQANSPLTIALKGFDKPLIHTGHMWQTVNSKITGV